MSIYTKKGDKGLTSTLSSKGGQIGKDTPLISTVGAIDEANSYIGICLSLLDKKRYTTESKLLFDAQRTLFTIGASLAGAVVGISKKEVKKYEKYIDKRESELPVLKNFILPGGSTQSSYLMYQRALIRKAEREVVRLSREKEDEPDVIIYLNRLSDATFMMARYVNYKMSVEEEVWAGKDK
jgi:cob(I)alamin adenosyltransferase